MGKLLGDITQPAVESRFKQLLVALEAVISSAIHPSEKLLRGALLGKMANGKYRAYFEAAVATGGAFSTSATTFTLEDLADSDLMKHLRVGDTIESVGGDALGEVATFDAETGVGTLTANSTSALAAGEQVRIISAELSVAKADARILKSETLVEDEDEPSAGYNEGFFNKKLVLGATDASIAAMGAKDLGDDEIRLV